MCSSYNINNGVCIKSEFIQFTFIVIHVSLKARNLYLLRLLQNVEEQIRVLFFFKLKPSLDVSSFFLICESSRCSHNATGHIHESTIDKSWKYDIRNIFTYEVTLICIWKTEVYILYAYINNVGFSSYMHTYIYATYMYARKFV